jgi:DNA modification methylase
VGVNKAEILVGDALASMRNLDDGSVRTCVTSPPYWGLRDYGNDGQLGNEATPQEFVENLCQVFDEVWRVLADDGTVWVNLGDSYNGAAPNRSGANGFNDGRTNRDKRFSVGGVQGLKPKDMVGIPWRFAFAMQDRAWYLRQDIIWSKPNPMPESVTDRCTKSHEYIFLFSKQPKYFFDHEAIQEPALHSGDRRAGQGRLEYDGKRQGEKGTGQEAFVSIKEFRNKRSVWNVGVASFKDAHFAVYPPALIEPCIKAGSAEGDTVLDPFSGSGTTGEVALKLGRNYIGCELNPDYARLSEKRITEALGMFADVEVKGE